MPLEVIAQFMDFDPKQYRLIQAEFVHKYKDTIIKVNNTFIKVANCICTSTNCTIFGTNGSYDPEKIEEWNPEVGLYVYKKNTLLFIQRIPERQYLKSFKIGANYLVSILEKTNYRVLGEMDANELEFKGMCCTFNNYLYLLHKKIGLVEENTIYLFPEYYNNFLNDVKELCPNYNITLLDASLLQKQAMIRKKKTITGPKLEWK